MTTKIDIPAIYTAIREGRPWVAPKPRSDAFDPELYTRALTGLGEPITSEEILDLIETIEQRDEDYAALREERDELETKYEEAWIVPKEEPDRACTQCVNPSHDRGDGRCVRHGRYVHPATEARLKLCESELGAARVEIIRLQSELRAAHAGPHEKKIRRRHA